MSENHKAVVVKLGAIRNHPNADRLVLTTIFGNQIVLGSEAKPGDLGLYFNCDLQLSEHFAEANDLVRRTDDEGKPAGGFFEKSRRVRCAKLRGERSDGFFIPIESLSHFGDVSSLREGLELEEFNGVPICNKYVVKSGKSSLHANNQAAKNPMFHEHRDTPHAGRYIPSLMNHKGSVVITEKLHGTSQRTGRVLADRELNFVESFIGKYFPKLCKIQTKDWVYVNGTRRVQLKPSTTEEPSFRDQMAAPFLHNLMKGEVVYYEVVGFEPSGKSIMHSVSLDKISDKSLKKMFKGSTITYSYGNQDKQASIYVYRITQVNEDGVEFDLSWESVKERCQELGVRHVPELFVGSLTDLLGTSADSDKVLEKLDEMSEGFCTFDESHIREGICVRLDGSEWNTFKHKSFTFKVLEGIERDLGLENQEDNA